MTFFKKLRIIFLLGFIACLTNQHQAQELRISSDGRFIVQNDGTPFFYLGDTAWELFHRLNREEADMYLEDRSAKGFNVIQAVVLAELDGLQHPNPYGEIPLIDNDPLKPNQKYFEHVDYVVHKAASLGMMVGMLPTWGDKYNKKWGVGPEIFTPENAYVFGKYLGERYRKASVIWILGGDRNPENEEDLSIVRAMASGIEAGDGGTHLMTYHPQGGNNSSQWFHSDDWLDFNFFQSGHGPLDAPNFEHTLSNYLLEPAKPTMDGEPRYEDHPVRFMPMEYGWFNDFDVRQAGYWSIFSGSCGHTYGNHNIWQMWQEGRKPVSWARTNWRRALDHPGAFQMGYMKTFFEAYPWQSMIPDQELILNFNPRSGAYQMAMISQERDIVFVYNPYGYPVQLDISRLVPEKLSAYWFNPRDGGYLYIGQFDHSYEGDFTPQSVGRGSDWVLILQDASRTYNRYTLVD